MPAGAPRAPPDADPVIAPWLIEREAEIATLRQALGEAAAGRGLTVALEAAAGHGKTSLLLALRDLTVEWGFRVLTGVGAPLERDFANGIVLQLFEAEVRRADSERADRLFADAARLSLPVFSVGPAGVGGEDPTHARLHGLYWLTANLAEERPLLLAVDDAHWADGASLRFLDVLTRRLADLPVLLAVAARPSEPRAEGRLLDEVLAHADVVLRPGALSRDGVGRALGDVSGHVPGPAFVAASLRSTGGNPLLVAELARSLPEAGLTGADAEADEAERLVPRSVVRTVTGRLRRLSPEALRFARGLAVLGDRSSVGVVARLAELEPEEAGTAHAALVRADLVASDGPRFVHPMVREAVAADLIGDEHAAWHARAARLLADGGAGEAEVAVHLLASPPRGDPAAVRTLLTSGKQALDAGAPDVARRHLRRALDEPPDAANLPAVLLALGLAETRIGDPAAATDLDAAAQAGDPLVAANAALVRANVLVLRGRPDDALSGLREAERAARPRAGDIADALEDTLLEALPYDDNHLSEYAQRLTDAPAPRRHAVLSHLALLRARADASRDEVIALARAALAGRELVRQAGTERLACFYALEALMAVEAVSDAANTLEQLADAARVSGSIGAAALLSVMQVQWQRRFGDLRIAEAEGRRGLELFTEMGNEGGVTLASVALASALLDRGDVAASSQFAETPAVDGRGYTWVSLLGLRARLAIADGRPQDALDQLAARGAVKRRRDWIVAERDRAATLRALALAKLERHEDARQLADDELAESSRRGLNGAQAAARVIKALTLPGYEAADELRRAVDAARRAASPVLLARALAQLGATLRRTGQRTAAREVLRESLDAARRCGADRLAAEAYDELVVAGARPRRIPIDGRDALTASERRIAELAAGGQSNKEIAQRLFLSVKTVEAHLGHTYAKLDIDGRLHLREALSAGEGGNAL